MVMEYDVIIVGGGPIGMACAIEAKRAGLSYVILEKGSLTDSIYRYPLHMQFFSTAERLEIGGIPFNCISAKPGRQEALEYYRNVQRYFSLNLQLYTKVERVGKTGHLFEVETPAQTYVSRFVIVATGFYTTDQPIAHHIKGREGRTLGDVWAEHGMASYKGTTTAGFPNLFQIVGANTGLGHSSMVFMIESQISYILSALQQMGAGQITAVEPREDVQAEWNEDMHQRMSKTVWSRGGCASWYLDEHGRNTTLWPRSTFAFRQLLREFDIEKYVTTSRSDATLSTQEKIA
ncbi:MAG: FAD-binding protein [Alphaproteobacteria bacterium]|nr:MAG: FAD-binding protein [Alphaproteobacteria bacterium]